MTDTDHPLAAAARPLREPPSIRSLPLDKHGRRIPWFVMVDEDGKPDHRVIKDNGIVEAVNRRLCWTCGTQLGRDTSFVIGAMCAVNRISHEPPSHRECSRYTASACPFLTTPNMRRREKGLPENHTHAGVMIKRNPGVVCIWYTTRYKVVSAPGGVLFELGEPGRVEWRARGRAATRAEVLASIDSGMPILRDACQRDDTPERSLAHVEKQYEVAMRYVPAA